MGLSELEAIEIRFGKLSGRVLAREERMADGEDLGIGGRGLVYRGNIGGGLSRANDVERAGGEWTRKAVQ